MNRMPFSSNWLSDASKAMHPKRSSRASPKLNRKQLSSAFQCESSSKSLQWSRITNQGVNHTRFVKGEATSSKVALETFQWFDRR